jgi:hypothetical protein
MSFLNSWSKMKMSSQPNVQGQQPANEGEESD